MPKKPSKKFLPYQVFVSHATPDKWIASAICEKIKKSGAVFFRDDKDIQGGDSIPQELRIAIRRSKEFIVLWSPETINRTWVHMEIGAAWLLKRRITVILCHTTMDTVPNMIKTEKAHGINDTPNYIKELRQRVLKHQKAPKKTS